VSKPFASLLLIYLLSSFCLAEDLGDLVLKQGVGARAAGMGGAFSAVANDASAVFYNPAGLAEPGFAYTYGSLDSEQRNNEFNFSLLKLGYLGYSEGRVANPAGDEIFFTALGFGNRSGWLNWGTNYKALDWTIGGIKDSGWTADIAFLARVTPKLKIGLVAQDILTTKSKLVPASGRVGISYKPFDGQVVLAADAEIYNNPPNYGHLGIEASVAKGLAFRAGVDRGRPTAGISLDMAAFSLDYAVLFQSEGKNLQRFEAGLKVLPGRERPFSIIKPREYVMIDIGGEIIGGQAEYSFFGGFKPGLDSILENIRTASKDTSLDGILIRIKGFSGGLGGAAVVQEIRAELQRAKTKGKKVVAYVEGEAVGDEYYLAAVADKIVAAPGSAVGGFGRSLEIYRFSGLFDKLGIQWQILSKGKYKTSFDWLSPGSTAEQKEMLEGMVADIYRQMLNEIAQDRKISIEKMKEIGDGMIFPSRLAEKMGLIDKVGYLNDARTAAAELCNSKEEVKLVEPQLLEPEEVFFSQVFGVAVIEVNGEIISGYGGQNLIFGGKYIGSDKVAGDIRKASDDIFVRAIILRIDSPGGSAVAAGEIYQALQYAKQKKKVVIASMGSVAASGGYYIASAANKIVADPSTITGSIGVIGSFPAYYKLMEKIGVTAEVIKEGSHADMFSGLRQFSSVEVMALNRILDESYDDFVSKVAAGRKLSTAEVEAVAEGRVYTGQQALDKRLVDKIGGFMDAVYLAKDEAKIMGDPRLVYYRDSNPFLQFGQQVSSALGLPPLMPGDPRSNLSRLLPQYR
jgi:protease-4